jgi:hypothetical protein
MKSNKKLVPNENSQIWSTSRAHHSSHVRPGQMKKKKKKKKKKIYVQGWKREKKQYIGTHQIKLKNTAQETKGKKQASLNMSLPIRNIPLRLYKIWKWKPTRRPGRDDEGIRSSGLHIFLRKGFS